MKSTAASAPSRSTARPSAARRVERKARAHATHRADTPVRRDLDSPEATAEGGALAACACGRLRRATRALTQLYDDAMAPAGLRVTQFSLLRTLAAEGAQRISTLAASLLLDRTALSRNLDPLIAQGFVEVVPGRDARTREVALTPAGRRALKLAQPHWRHAQEVVAQRVGASKLSALIDTLHELEALHPGAAMESPASRRGTS